MLGRAIYNETREPTTRYAEDRWTYLSSNCDLLTGFQAGWALASIGVVEYDCYTGFGYPGSTSFVDEILLIGTAKLGKTHHQCVFAKVLPPRKYL